MDDKMMEFKWSYMDEAMEQFTARVQDPGIVAYFTETMERAIERAYVEGHGDGYVEGYADCNSRFEKSVKEV